MSKGIGILFALMENQFSYLLLRVANSWVVFVNMNMYLICFKFLACSWQRLHLTLLYYASKKDRSMLQSQKSQASMKLPEVPSQLQNKSGNLTIYNITRFGMNASVTKCKNGRPY
jgi:hypothetical protein